MKRAPIALAVVLTLGLSLAGAPGEALAHRHHGHHAHRGHVVVHRVHPVIPFVVLPLVVLPLVLARPPVVYAPPPVTYTPSPAVYTRPPDAYDSPAVIDVPRITTYPSSRTVVVTPGVPTVVVYPTGRYVLQGNGGMSTPYVWVWEPNPPTEAQ